MNKPMSFELSAPGKIILFGEYSVVFNKPALAATLAHRTRLRFEESSDNLVLLKFSSVNLNKHFSLHDLRKHFKYDSVADEHDPVESIWKSLLNLSQENDQLLDLSHSQKLSLIAFFHSFSRCFHLSQGFHLEIHSDLSVGSGVGSSASFSVVLSAAVLIYQYYLNQQGHINNIIERCENGYFKLMPKLQTDVSELAFSCEKIFHGSPSGVDNNTVLRGSVLEFVKSDDGNNEIQSIRTRPIRVLLVNTNVQRSTKTLVGNVRKLKENHPEVIENILKAMESVALSAKQVLLDFDTANDVATRETHFGELISLNHSLLRALEVSHPKLEEIVSIANKHGLNGKLTGAGGGGFSFIYLPSHVETSVIENVQAELTKAGFGVSSVLLGGPGLLIEKLSF